MKISVVLYVYPGIEKYLNDLINSINKQSIREFDTIIFNDKVNNLPTLLKDLDIKYSIFDITGSINQIRFNSLKILSTVKSEFFIFQDADDFMSENRIKENLLALKNYDLVVNDLSLVDENSQSLETPYWSKRLENCFEFDESFLRNKNIVGFGNTSIKKTLLTDSRLSYSSLPLAFDWFLFYQIFELNDLKALFISKATTFYRQHQDNIAGIKKFDLPRLKHVYSVKKNHYMALISIGYNFKKELDQLNQINFKNIDFLKFNSNKENLHLFWWEETNILKNNYE